MGPHTVASTLRAVHIHLDAVGGIAGDMFVAAIADAVPGVAGAVADAMKLVDLPDSVSTLFVQHTDGILTGSRFVVEDNASEHDDHHRSFADIRDMLLKSDLESAVRDHAISIFTLLAEAEGSVHGRPVEDVTFHEVGSWDSIADIVGAAAAIVASGATTWSMGPVPIGSGRVNTAHGVLPVPAPATAVLLEGFDVFDDGVPGERITPTGAAIVRHLRPSARPPGVITLGTFGHGFGTKVFPSMSNVLRATTSVSASTNEDTPTNVVVLRYEVDDQTPEDLAIGLEHIRATDGVLDVSQSSVLAKKGRQAFHVQVIAQVDSMDAVIEACFRETATIGIRHTIEGRVVLDRSVERVEVAGKVVRVKTVDRPGGATRKADIDDLAGVGDRQQRAATRSVAEDV
jgi:uncharacterized protein (TIGR00299 family) protein